MGETYSQAGPTPASSVAAGAERSLRSPPAPAVFLAPSVDYRPAHWPIF